MPKRRPKFGNTRALSNSAKLRKGMTEDELKEYGSMVALESKIKMLSMMIQTKGDPDGKRRAALNNLKHQVRS